ncbi:hypothetical protein ACKVEX_10625 [Rhodocyclaceae bacterium SMB388]
MRTFQAFVIILCLIGGLYLLQGPEFYWPDRGDPSHATHLAGWSSRLLGLALLTTAGLGVMIARQAGRADGKAAPRAWQLRFFVLLMLVIGLINAAFQLGEHGPNPESRRYVEPR